MKDSDILRQLISLAFDTDPADTAVTLLDCLDLLTRTVVAEQRCVTIDTTQPHGSCPQNPSAFPPPPPGRPADVGGRGTRFCQGRRPRRV